MSMSQYYYTDGKERFGPFSIDELRDKPIDENTLVWKEGLPDWVPANKMAELNSLFASATEFTPAYNEPYRSPAITLPPKNYLIESILVTVFCCMPLGIVGVIHAAKVDNLWKHGHPEEAYKSSREAGKWVKIGAIIGFVVIVIYLLLFFMGIVAGISNGIEV